MISSVKEAKSDKEKKAKYTPLLLDSLGREIDEKGNLVRQTSQIKTLSANVAVGKAQKKRENPYLAHKALPTGQIPILPGIQSTFTPEMNSDVSTAVLDDRLVSVSRERKAKKALHFAEAGK